MTARSNTIAPALVVNRGEKRNAHKQIENISVSKDTIKYPAQRTGRDDFMYTSSSLMCISPAMLSQDI